MLKSTFSVFVLMVTLSLPAKAQITLDTEEYTSGHYRVTFHNQGYPYSIRENRDGRTIVFTVPANDGVETSAILPHKDLFIALPPNSHPDITLVITGRESISNAVPALSPKVHLINDSLVGYTPVTGRPLHKTVNTVSYKMNGYLWIGN